MMPAIEHAVRECYFARLFSWIIAPSSGERLKKQSVSCRPLALFVIDRGLDRLLPSRFSDERQEKGTVVTAHAGMASHNLEEEQATHFIPPSSWPGFVYFSFAAAIRAAQHSDPAHNKPLNPLSNQKKVAQFLRGREGLRHQTKQPSYWKGILQVAIHPKMFKIAHF
jgi:hypothetical protein